MSTTWLVDTNARGSRGATATFDGLFEAFLPGFPPPGPPQIGEGKGAVSLEFSLSDGPASANGTISFQAYLDGPPHAFFTGNLSLGTEGQTFTDYDLGEIADGIQFTQVSVSFEYPTRKMCTLVKESMDIDYVLADCDTPTAVRWGPMYGVTGEKRTVEDWYSGLYEWWWWPEDGAGSIVLNVGGTVFSWSGNTTDAPGSLGTVTAHMRANQIGFGEGPNWPDAVNLEYRLTLQLAGSGWVVPVTSASYTSYNGGAEHGVQLEGVVGGTGCSLTLTKQSGDAANRMPWIVLDMSGVPTYNLSVSPEAYNILGSPYPNGHLSLVPYLAPEVDVPHLILGACTHIIRYPVELYFPTTVDPSNSLALTTGNPITRTANDYVAFVGYNDQPYGLTYGLVNAEEHTVGSAAFEWVYSIDSLANHGLEKNAWSAPIIAPYLGWSAIGCRYLTSYDVPNLTSSWTALGDTTLDTSGGVAALSGGATVQQAQKVTDTADVWLDLLRYLTVDVTLPTGGCDVDMEDVASGKKWTIIGATSGTLIFDLIAPNASLSGVAYDYTRYQREYSSDSEGDWAEGLNRQNHTLKFTFHTTSAVSIDGIGATKTAVIDEAAQQTLSVMRGITKSSDFQVGADNYAQPLITRWIQGRREAQEEYGLVTNDTPFDSVGAVYSISQVLNHLLHDDHSSTTIDRGRGDPAIGLSQWLDLTTLGSGSSSTSNGVVYWPRAQFCLNDKPAYWINERFHTSTYDSVLTANVKLNRIAFGPGACEPFTISRFFSGGIKGFLANSDGVIRTSLGLKLKRDSVQVDETATTNKGLYSLPTLGNVALVRNSEGVTPVTFYVIPDSISAQGVLSEFIHGVMYQCALAGESLPDLEDIDFTVNLLSLVGTRVYANAGSIYSQRTFDYGKTYELPVKAVDSTTARRPAVFHIMGDALDITGLLWDDGGVGNLLWSSDGFRTGYQVTNIMNGVTHFRADQDFLSGVLLIAGWRSDNSGEIVAARTTDLGATLSTPVVVASAPEQAFGLRFVPSTMGHWVIAYRDATSTQRTKWSTDHGLTWHDTI